MGCAALVLDSRRRVLPRLDIGVRRRCWGLDRRGPTVTGGGEGKHYWIILPTKYQMVIDHPKWVY